ncbi:MAG: PEGA domain-containing protein, partial [Vicinamibacterales bacterium]
AVLLTVVSGAGWAAANRFFDGPAEVARASTPVEPPPPVNVTPPAPEPVAESTPIAPLGAPTGQLDIRTDPPGATVTIAGLRRGVTPLTIPDLAPGRHTVLLESAQGSTTRQVTVEAGITASLVTDLPDARAVPTAGFVTVAAPSAVDILENGRLLGSSQRGRLTLPAGPHQLEIVNQALGYRITRTVQVTAGSNTPINLEFPKGTLALNAIPWAEVFVDGEKVGDTPIGNLPVSLGSHEVIFRNPDLGEQRMTATVTLTAPTRLSVDLRKR